jgi:hypothetical protein
MPDTTQPAKETTMANTTMPDTTQLAEETTIRTLYCRLVEFSYGQHGLKWLLSILFYFLP